MRTSDYFTAPSALRVLHDLPARGDRARVQLRYSSHDKFHAKAFGFRAGKSSPPTVLIGSANLLHRATGPDSGELGVRLAGGMAASHAWAALEGFWREGIPITPKWLTAYQKKYRSLEKARAKAKAALAKVRQPRRRNDLARSVPVPAALYVKGSRWMSAARVAQLEEAAEVDGVSLPSAYYECGTKPAALALPRERAFLDLELTNDGTEIRRICLVRVGGPVSVRGHLQDGRTWLVPWEIVRGSKMGITRRDATRFASCLRRHRITVAWLAKRPDGYLRRRRRPLLKALAEFGWKPARAVLGLP